MQHIETQEKFDEIIQGDKPVIVKFFADRCPDCKRMDMFIDDIIKKFSNYAWYEVNNDKIKGISEKYKVMGMPSILIFQDGEKKAHQHSDYTKSPELVSEFLHQQLG